MNKYTVCLNKYTVCCELNIQFVMKNRYKVYEGYYELFISTNMLDLTLVNEFDTMAEAEEFCENSDYWM